MNNTPVRASLALRIAGGVVFFGLTGLLILWNIAAIALPAGPYSWLPGALLGVGVLACFYAVWRRILVFESIAGVGTGAVVLLVAIVYLAWDEATVVQPLTMDELVPPAREAAAGYAATLVFTAHDGRPAQRPRPESKSPLRHSPVEKPVEWAQEVLANRGPVAERFASFAPGRVWLEELDQFAEIGDMPQAAFDAPIINASMLRQTAVTLCDEAAARAQAGRGDEAFDLLRPLVSVAVKLERHARTELRIISAGSVLRRALATADYVLATAPVSAERKAALTAAVAGRDLAQVRHRLAWINYVMLSEVILKSPGTALVAMSLPDGAGRFWARLLGWMHPVVLLPRTTANLLAAFSETVERLLEDPAARTLASDAGMLYRQLQSPSPKNFGGRALILIAVPNYRRLAENLDDSERRRVALLAKLTP